VEPGALVVADLDLDLWVSADGATVLRLDEDEFEESGLSDRDPGAAARARQALDELERLARNGGFSELLGSTGPGATSA
jgi:predicted RNA-binding protein associated with RNAse of E/G family